MNRRHFLRFNVNLDVRYRIIESLQPYQDTCTEDLAEKGLRLNLSDYIEPGTNLELNIRIPDETGLIAAMGRVIWAKKDPAGDFFTTGIEILRISEENKKKIYKYAVL